MILTVPAHFYGEITIGSVLLPGPFSQEVESLIDFIPKYFSFKILGFLLSRGSCSEGAYCWAELPPPLLCWQVNYMEQNIARFPHENKFLELLCRKWPKIFVKKDVRGLPLEPRPPLELLKRSASSWGL